MDGGIAAELNELFAGSSPDGLRRDVLLELQSILRVQSISAQELFYKWESYCLKMGSEETRLSLDTVRAFKRDVQEALERESRGKTTRQAEKRNAVLSTPRTNAAKSDVFGMQVFFSMQDVMNFDRGSVQGMSCVNPLI